MAAKTKSFHSNIVFKNDTSPQTSKMQNMASESKHQFLKAFITERNKYNGEGNEMENKPFSDTKKACYTFAQNHSGKELLKVVRKGTEKLSIKESKGKSGTHSKKMCFCSPTTHEGSFRCHLHRISAAAKKSAAEKKSNLRMNSSKRTHGMVEFKPQLSRFGRIASAEVGPRDSLIQLSRVESA